MLIYRQTEKRNIMNLDTMSKLSAIYSEPHRHYHNIDHINYCLAQMVEFLKSPEGKQLNNMQREGLEYAIMMHDVVYNPYFPPGLNEEMSHRVAHSSGRAAGLCSLGIMFADEAILATATHAEDNSDNKSPVVKAMLDIDLASLAAPENIYRRNTNNIRREYWFVPDDIFRQHQLAFLQTLYNRGEDLYYTEYFRNKCTEDALYNLRKTLTGEW